MALLFSDSYNNIMQFLNFPSLLSPLISPGLKKINRLGLPDKLKMAITKRNILSGFVDSLSVIINSTFS